MWGERTEVQIFMREFHTHIPLDYVRVKILFCIKKKNYNKSKYLINRFSIISDDIMTQKSNDYLFFLIFGYYFQSVRSLPKKCCKSIKFQ